MVSKVNVKSDVPSLTHEEIKVKLVDVFKTAFDEVVENGDISLSGYDDGVDIVDEVAEAWNGNERLVGINEVVKALGFTLTGEMTHDVTFSIK